MNPRLVLAVLLAIAAAPAVAQTRNCRIADPGGAAPEARATPNGRIVGTVPNGHSVFVLDRTRRRGRDWTYIAGASDRQPIGWVVRDVVRCG